VGSSYPLGRDWAFYILGFIDPFYLAKSGFEIGSDQ